MFIIWSLFFFFFFLISSFTLWWENRTRLLKTCLHFRHLEIEHIIVYIFFSEFSTQENNALVKYQYIKVKTDKMCSWNEKKVSQKKAFTKTIT